MTRTNIFVRMLATLIAGVASADEMETTETIIKKIQPAAGLKLELFAREPMLRNPVCFTVDQDGRFYVAETYRFNEGVTDIRAHMGFLEEDLACRTVADQIVMLEKHLPDYLAKYAESEDRIKRIEDTDGDGQADEATIFSDGYRGTVSGIGSGVLARGNNVWYANIPNLWQLNDADDDGVADTRKTLHTGYGVHLSFIGHDLHGLIFGPDGKIYFTVGDRGMNVTTPEGVVSSPDCGAVMRCDPDGLNLELYATGLRNPQELAFDDFGNLWTCDNNSDSGDKARLVHVVEGGDSGWRIGYQSLDDRGPWNREKLWHVGDYSASQLPPIAHVGHGPSGLAFNPGTGMPAEYDQHFFMADFPAQVLAFAVKEKGASFEVVNPRVAIDNVWATDVDFGRGPGLYVLDWAFGWPMPGKGRIFRLFNTEADRSSLALKTAKLLKQGMEKRTLDELGKLLAHADRRVRQEAQFELVGRGSKALPLLRQTIKSGQPRLARLHALWALGQLISEDNHGPLVVAVNLLDDEDVEIQCQIAKMLGENQFHPAGEFIVKLLSSGQPRVRFFAAMALAKLRWSAADAVIQMLRENKNQDPYLRHAGVMALAAMNDQKALAKASKDESVAVRMASVLASRRLKRAEVAQFLGDDDPEIVLETARAINDVPIDEATAALAAHIEKPIADDRVLRRVINANYRSGTIDNAKALVRFALDKTKPEPWRLMALQLLGRWGGPTGRDHVTGAWRPMQERNRSPAEVALTPHIDTFSRDSEAIKVETIRAVSGLKLADQRDRLLIIFENTSESALIRVEAMRALAAMDDVERLSSAVKAGLDDSDTSILQEAIRQLPRVKAADMADRMEKLIFSSLPLPLRQTAILALMKLEGKAIDHILLRCLDELESGRLPIALRLEVLEVVSQKPQVEEKWGHKTGAVPEAAATQPVELLEGGNVKAGRDVFYERQEAGCMKCHMIDGFGGVVGPDLSGIAGRRTPAQLLDSILNPNKEISPEFKTVILFTDDDSCNGRILRETDTLIVLMNNEGAEVEVDKGRVVARKDALSAMPENVTELLKPRDIRDLVAFLSALKPKATSATAK